MAQPTATHGAQGLEREPALAGTVVPRAFIAEQSAGTLLRNTLALYRTNFRPLFLAYVLPTFPVLVLQQVAEATKNVGLYMVMVLVGWLVSFIAIGALTITISDICLGNLPMVRRAYGKILQGGLWLRLFLTGLLQTLLMAAGFLLLLIPGVFLTIRLIVCSTVVVLEGDSGMKAIKRSMNITKGHFWRLFAVLALLSLLAFALAFILMLPVGIALAVLESVLEEGHMQIVIGILVAALLQGVFYPMIFIAVVLLYYDLRARKEAYDVETLAEDMMR